jgi:hypothetical protein
MPLLRDEVQGKFCPIVISSDGWIGESGDINDIIDPIIRSISLLAVGEDRGTNSDDRIPNIEL